MKTSFRISLVLLVVLCLWDVARADTWLVTNTVTRGEPDTVEGSLFWAVKQANRSAAVDTICFSTGGHFDAPPYTGLHLQSGASGCFFDGRPLSGSHYSVVLDSISIVIDSAEEVLITGLTVVNGGIRIRSSGNCIYDCFLGYDVTGTVGNGGGGISIAGRRDARSTYTVIERCVLSGIDGEAISVSHADSTVIVNNWIGADSTGMAAIPNFGNGIGIYSTARTTAIHSNLIVGSHIGITCAASDVTIMSNYIGVDISGLDTLPNLFTGISVAALDDTIRDVVIAGNVITGNGHYGITMSTVRGFMVDNNLIGTTADTGKVIGNGLSQMGYEGIEIFGCDSGCVESNVVCGGRYDGIYCEGAPIDLLANRVYDNGGNGVLYASRCSAIRDNIVCGNGKNGLSIFAGTRVSEPDSLIIERNRIGMDENASSARNNGGYGIQLSGAWHARIGDSTAAGRNYIADGIKLRHSANYNTIENNFIGTDTTGTLGFGSDSTWGIMIGSSHENIVRKNVIANMEAGGIQIYAGVKNRLENNLIGTDSSGNVALANRGPGVHLFAADSNIVVENVVAYNAGDGVKISEWNTTWSADNEICLNAIHDNGGDGVCITGDGSDRNLVSANGIYDNAGLGIDLGDDGVTANDMSDTDVGPNQGMNFPIITAVVAHDSDSVVVLGTAPPGSWVELFWSGANLDPSGHGEGRYYRTILPIPAHGTFEIPIAASGRYGLVTATACDDSGNTSEFSAWQMVGPDITIADTLHDFGTVVQGDTARWDSLVIRSTGTLALTVDSLTFSDTGAVWATNATLPRTLAPGASMTVTVNLRCAVEGAHAETLWVHSNDPDDNEKVIAVVVAAQVGPPTALIPVRMRDIPTRLYVNHMAQREASGILLRFGLPWDAGVEIELWTLEGRRAAHAMIPPRPAGHHLISLRGRFATGTYMVKLDAGRGSVSQKVRLVR